MDKGRGVSRYFGMLGLGHGDSYSIKMKEKAICREELLKVYFTTAPKHEY